MALVYPRFWPFHIGAFRRRENNPLRPVLPEALVELSRRPHVPHLLLKVAADLGDAFAARAPVVGIRDARHVGDGALGRRHAVDVCLLVLAVVGAQAIEIVDRRDALLRPPTPRRGQRERGSGLRES
jgi:hypothetical protein